LFPAPARRRPGCFAGQPSASRPSAKPLLPARRSGAAKPPTWPRSIAPLSPAPQT